MILYRFRCRAGHEFEQFVPSMDSENPPCECGEATNRKPGSPRLIGVASPGPSRDEMPNSWRGTGRGDPETIRHWHSKMKAREKLEEKYPELAGDRRPVLAHEGSFESKPLRAGDSLAAKVSAATFQRQDSVKKTDPKPAGKEDKP